MIYATVGNSFGDVARKLIGAETLNYVTLTTQSGYSFKNEEILQLKLQ